MKKETVIAIVLGIILGLVVAVGVTFTTRKKTTPKVTPISNTLNVTPTITTKSTQSQLTISEPQNAAITNKNSITIKGKAIKNGLIVIQSPIQTEIFTNDTDEFSQSFNLALGENIILISYYPVDPTVTMQEKEIKVYYLDE